MMEYAGVASGIWITVQNVELIHAKKAVLVAAVFIRDQDDACFARDVESR